MIQLKACTYGRKDKTKIQTGIVTKEHISPLTEPNSQYVAHVTLSSGITHHLFMNISRVNSKVY